jgi:hypothetical protein
VSAAAEFISSWPGDLFATPDPFLYSLLEWFFDCEEYYCWFGGRPLSDKYVLHVHRHRTGRVESPDEILAALWATRSALAARAATIAAGLRSVHAHPYVNDSQLIKLETSQDEYEGAFGRFCDLIQRTKSALSHLAPTSPEHRSLLYLDVFRDSAQLFLRNHVAQWISTLEMQPHGAPGNGYSDSHSVHQSILNLRTFFGKDSLVPCLLPMTIVTIISKDAAIKGYITECEVTYPELVRPYMIAAAS